MISPDLPPADSLAATRFTIGDFDVSFIHTYHTNWCANRTCARTHAWTGTTRTHDTPKQLFMWSCTYTVHACMHARAHMPFSSHSMFSCAYSYSYSYCFILLTVYFRKGKCFIKLKWVENFNNVCLQNEKQKLVIEQSVSAFCSKKKFSIHSVAQYLQEKISKYL